MFLNATICAIASPTGEGAVAVIRLSGSDSYTIINKVFKSKSGKKDFQPHTLYHGYIYDNFEVCDEVLITIYKKPHSYTGEDSVEIFCHGSTYIQNRILELLIMNGAEQAREGEFTLRAFLNGKIDLTQAEAVNDLIQSKTKLANKLAVNQLRGNLSAEISLLRKKLIDFVSLIELELDFGEEDVEFANRHKLLCTVTELREYIDNLLKSFTLGNAIKNGVPTVIAGEPNVGKSTLLNLILRENKAIVSEIPGTTRDVIEDTVNIGDVLFRFMDTAGIRKTTDTIEAQGIARTYRSIEQASLILYLLDANEDAESILVKANQFLADMTDFKKILFVINKIDKISPSVLNTLKSKLDNSKLEYFIMSAIDVTYLPLLEEKMLKLTGINIYNEEQVLVTNTRHFEALKLSAQALENVANGLNKKIPEDLLTQDLKQALFYLGEISGEITPDDILHNIFNHFCIGK